MLICDHRFHAVLLRKSSDRERKILEKSKKKKLKNAVKRMLGLCTTLFLCVCMCVCVCVCLYRLYLSIVTCGCISDC